MKENPYDDLEFFEKYNQMSRSRIGLAGAGEWETLRPLLPDLKGLEILDLGCGMGWHAAYAADQGAARVVGTDRSEKMLEQAVRLNSRPQIAYCRSAFEESVFDSGSFDLVLCSLMLHYLASYDQFLDRVTDWLRPGGTLAFTVEHPVFTAEGSQQWYCDGEGRPIYFPVDRYYLEGMRNAVFLGESVVKYHRTLTTYLEGLLRRGYRLEHVVEPMPTPAMVAEIPGMADELRRPMMLIVTAKRPEL